MRIKYLAPALTDRDAVTARASHLAGLVRDPATDIRIEALGLGRGLPADGMGRVAADAEVVALGARAESEGYDAVVVDSIVDAGVDALRSRLSIPVIGAGRSGLMYGAILGGRSAIAVRTAEERRAVDRAIVLAEAEPLVSSVGVIGGSTDEVEAARKWAGSMADDAGVLILGHPELAATREELAARLDIQVIDPGALALKVAEAMIDLGLHHSEIAYLAPAVDLDHLLWDRLETSEVIAVDVAAPSQPPRGYRLKVVVPISGMTEADVGLRADALAPGLLHDTTRVDYRSLSDSSNSGDCMYDTFLLDVFCAEEALRADEEGYDAVLVDSTTDSGIPSVRPHLRTLSLGPGESCWALASVIGEHFTILSMERKWEFFFIKGPKSVGMANRLASVEEVSVPADPVRLFEGKEELMNQKLIEASRSAIDEHRADVIIIGSTTMHQALPALSEALPVPILSPGRIGVRTAEMLLDLGLRHAVAPADPSGRDPRTLFDASTKKDSPLVHA